jgi:hypothetical protein
MPRDTQRQVRFASHLEPPFTDAEDARYTWQREQALPDEEGHVYPTFTKLCFMLIGVISLFSSAIIAVYFIFKGSG